MHSVEVSAGHCGPLCSQECASPPSEFNITKIFNHVLQFVNSINNYSKLYLFVKRTILKLRFTHFQYFEMIQTYRVFFNHILSNCLGFCYLLCSPMQDQEGFPSLERSKLHWLRMQSIMAPICWFLEHF